MGQLLEAVRETAEAKQASAVVRINLTIGDASCVVDDSLLYYFDMLAADTVVAGAEIAITRKPMRFRCDAGDGEYAVRAHRYECPTCGRVGVLVDRADDFTVESIEIRR